MGDCGDYSPVCFGLWWAENDDACGVGTLRLLLDAVCDYADLGALAGTLNGEPGGVLAVSY